MDLDEIAQKRFDAQEIGEIECFISIERYIDEPRKLLSEYRYKFNGKKRIFARESVKQVTLEIDVRLIALAELLEKPKKKKNTFARKVDHVKFEEVREYFKIINTLLGDDTERPSGWGDMARHLSFGMTNDLSDIINRDWPVIKKNITKYIYEEFEPVPLDVDDLGVIDSHKTGKKPVIKLNWSSLSESDFERLIYTILKSESIYEDIEWLTETNAPDRGRDISAYRVLRDPLSGIVRHRVIIQCKHWRSKSVSDQDISKLIVQMRHWEPPRVDILIIASSGRFTADAVATIEKQNISDHALKIIMWPENHLESILAGKPVLLAEFQLR